MKKCLTVFALVLSLVMVMPLLAPQEAVVAYAAEKPYAYLDMNTIGINGTTKVYIENKNSKATYSFSSSKSSVASVSNKGVVTGKKAGTAKITVQQKYKGKTSKVGTLKVVVKNSKINKYVKVERTAQPGYFQRNPFKERIDELVEYRNPKAKYSFSSDSDDLVISKDGKVTEVKNPGKANYIIKETYKGKTRTVGKMPVVLREPKYYGLDTIQLYIGDKFDLRGDADGDYAYFNTPMLAGVCKYNFFWNDEVRSDEEILQSVNDNENGNGDLDSPIKLNIKKGAWDQTMNAQKEGTVNCAIVQWNYLESKFDKVIGRFNIVVSDASKLTDFQFPWEREKMEGEIDEGYTYDSKTNTVEASLYASSYYDEDEGGISLYMKQVPSVYYGTYKVQSSDSSVVSVEAEDYAGYDNSKPKTYGDEGFTTETDGSIGREYPYITSPDNRIDGGRYLNLRFNKAGKATITVKAGGVEKSFDIHVIDEDDEDDEDYDEEEDY